MNERDPKQRRVVLGDAERQAFISQMEEMFRQAVVFTEECLDYMAAQRLTADRAAIDPTVFYYRHLGQRIEFTISGRPMQTVFEAVKFALDNVHPRFLGLAPQGSATATIVRNQRDYAEIKAQAEGRVAA